jgi:hypothetical protein
VRRLGAGAMGEVFLGRSPSSRLVAVKTIRAGLAEHPGYRRRFAHEVDAARRVSGAFTAAVVGADPHADLPWLATVYVPAPSLEELVASCGPLAVSAVRWLAAGCAEALECVHRAGLVHRDFKPGNVLVTADGPRVIDFGLARSDGLPQGTAAGMVLGTPMYMAPEQAAGDPATGAAADVFALGATLYQAATGVAPYQDAKAMGAILQAMQEPPDLAPVPPELHGLLLACLAVEPDDRPTPAELIARLSPYLASAHAAPPLPEAVLEHIEEYRRVQMELTRARPSLSEAETVVVAARGAGARARGAAGVGGAALGDDLAEDSGDFSGDFGGDSSGGPVGDAVGDRAGDIAGDSTEEDSRPRHPSLLPARALANRRHSRGGSRGRARSRHQRALAPALVAVGVTFALGGATIGGLLITGALRLSGATGGDRTHDANPAVSSPSATILETATRPSGPPPTASPPPSTRGDPLASGPPPVPQQGDQRPPQGGPPGPPPGAVTEINGTQLGVRPPFGDPRTTFILNGFGWPAGQAVTITFVDGAAPQTRTVVDSTGAFSVAVDQGPGAVGLPNGRYHVRATSGALSETVSFVVGPPLT